ncbi:MAG: hypothetical protein KF851_17965 [Pirellulaceae bacterium]|nr:hypothetical protein [Pirellulaceae bacterium]
MDNLRLQRFVDGHMSVEELQRLAKDAEAQTSLWRDLAVAVIEEKIWQRTLTNDTLTCATESSESRLVRKSESGSPQSKGVFTRDDKPSAFDHHSRSSSSWRSYIMVACSLLAFPLVFWAGLMTNPRSEVAELNKAQGPSETLPVAIDNSWRTNQDGATSNPPIRNADRRVPQINAPFSLQFSNNDQIQSTPLLPESTAREIGYRPSASDFPAELQNRFRRDGYQLNSQIYYLQWKTQDGREIIVPVESVNVAIFGQ